MSERKIFTCPECGYKEVSQAEEQHHNCGEQTSYKMRSLQVNIRAVGRIAEQVWNKLNEENLIYEGVKGFGTDIREQSFSQPFDRKTGLLKKKGHIDETKVVKAITEVMEKEPVDISFQPWRVDLGINGRKVQVHIHLDELRKVEDKIIEEEMA